MTLDEKIRQYTKELPYAFQQELLDYIQYLKQKAEQHEKQDWSLFSLSSALCDAEDEGILYSLSDLKVVFA